ncbi:MAG: hypothetical protein ABIJ56_17585 [Pseudomonadota bacterium]
MKKFLLGMGLMLTFIVILVLIFLPILNGGNMLEYSDALYNSISKGSADYIDATRKEVEGFKGPPVSLAMEMSDEAQAEKTALLFEKGGASVKVAGRNLTVEGDLGKILLGCLDDSRSMYDNDGQALMARYGYGEKRVMVNWWAAAKAMDKALKREKRFDDAKLVTLVQNKAVETAYNFYGIAPQKIGDKLFIVVFSLLFYVLYTVWYGFAIMFMFEGLGFRLGH